MADKRLALNYSEFLFVFFFVLSSFETGVRTLPSAERSVDQVSCFVQRSLAIVGFHRKLNTKLMISLKNNSQTLVYCEAFLSEKLSLTYDVSVFETETVHRYGGPKVFTYDKSHFEKTAFLPTHVVYVINPLTIHNDTLSVNISVPLHIKYTEPISDDNPVSAYLLIPKVSVACYPEVRWPLSFKKIVAPCSNDTNANCFWTQIPCQFYHMTNMFEEPVSSMDESSIQMLIAKSVFIIVLSISLGLLIAMCLFPEDTTRNGAPQANRRN